MKKLPILLVLLLTTTIVLIGCTTFEDYEWTARGFVQGISEPSTYYKGDEEVTIVSVTLTSRATPILVLVEDVKDLQKGRYYEILLVGVDTLAPLHPVYHIKELKE